MDRVGRFGAHLSLVSKGRTCGGADVVVVLPFHPDGCAGLAMLRLPTDYHPPVRHQTAMVTEGEELWARLVSLVGL